MAIKKKETKEKDTKKKVESIDSLIAKNTEINQELIPTHILPIDMHADGGILRGDMWEFSGDTGVGKSTALTHLSANLCGQGYKIMYLDFERGQKTTDKSLINNMGLRPYMDADQFILKKNLITFTHLEDAYKEAIELGVDFVFIDSLTSVVPKSLLDTPLEQATVGVEARIQTMFVKKYKSIGQLYGITTIFISQERTKIAMGYGEKTETKSAGAKALGFYCDLRFVFTKGPKITRKERTGASGIEEVICGNLAKIYTLKNRCNRSEIKIPIPILFGKGVSNPYFYYYILDANGYIKTAGAWKSFDIPNVGEIRAQGEVPLIEQIAINKQVVYEFLKERNHFELIMPDIEDGDNDLDNVTDTNILDTISEESDHISTADILSNENGL